MEDKAIINIYRFDPAVDKQPRYETYEVPPEGWQGAKVVDVIRYIYEKFAPGLSFREACGQHRCGVCTVMVNNKPVLACKTLSEKEMTIEPLVKHRVIKDLVVERSDT